ncbi:MAG: hypothetical protein LBD12_02220, partial [Clostridiales Family XIII bacterium]|nr:hypothetical protein [Clostridiales Family XIII bacterium]
MRLFFKECKMICKSVVWLAFVVVALLFYLFNMGLDLGNEIRQTETGKDSRYDLHFPKIPVLDLVLPLSSIILYTQNYDIRYNPLLPPDRDATDYGVENAIVPEKTMPHACALLAKEYLYERGDFFMNPGKDKYIREG